MLNNLSVKFWGDVPNNAEVCACFNLFSITETHFWVDRCNWIRFDLSLVQLLKTGSAKVVGSLKTHLTLLERVALRLKSCFRQRVHNVESKTVRFTMLRKIKWGPNQERLHRLCARFIFMQYEFSQWTQIGFNTRFLTITVKHATVINPFSFLATVHYILLRWSFPLRTPKLMQLLVSSFWLFVCVCSPFGRFS